MTTLERKIADQKKLIQSLYDDLESREKFIEMLQVDMKDTSRKNAQSKKKFEAEKDVLEDKLEEKIRIINELKSAPKFECSKGCGKYNKSVDEIYEAGVKHKNKLIDLKEIADEQKVKISCLRKHRDEIQNNFYKLEDVHQTTIKETNEKVSQLDEEIIVMKKQLEDQKDEIDIKRNENVISVESNIATETVKSLQEELGLNELDSQMLECNHCENTFLNKKDLKKHVKDIHVAQARSNLITLERKIASQTKTLATSNFELIQIEIAVKHNPCKCRYKFCRIIHSKHNWSKSFVTDIIARFKKVKGSKSEDGEVEEYIQKGEMSRI